MSTTAKCSTFQNRSRCSSPKSLSSILCPMVMASTRSSAERNTTAVGKRGRCAGCMANSPSSRAMYMMESGLTACQMAMAHSRGMADLFLWASSVMGSLMARCSSLPFGCTLACLALTGLGVATLTLHASCLIQPPLHSARLTELAVGDRVSKHGETVIHTRGNGRQA
jgi:hypothetical protein